MEIWVCFIAFGGALFSHFRIGAYLFSINHSCYLKLETCSPISIHWLGKIYTFYRTVNWKLTRLILVMCCTNQNHHWRYVYIYNIWIWSQRKEAEPHACQPFSVSYLFFFFQFQPTSSNAFVRLFDEKQASTMYSNLLIYAVMPCKYPHIFCFFLFLPAISVLFQPNPFYVRSQSFTFTNV